MCQRNCPDLDDVTNLCDDCIDLNYQTWKLEQEAERVAAITPATDAEYREHVEATTLSAVEFAAYARSGLVG
jgi:hypothetical protein